MNEIVSWTQVVARRMNPKVIQKIITFQWPNLSGFRLMNCARDEEPACTSQVRRWWERPTAVTRTEEILGLLQAEKSSTVDHFPQLFPSALNHGSRRPRSKRTYNNSSHAVHLRASASSCKDRGSSPFFGPRDGISDRLIQSSAIGLAGQADLPRVSMAKGTSLLRWPTAFPSPAYSHGEVPPTTSYELKFHGIS